MRLQIGALMATRELWGDFLVKALGSMPRQARRDRSRHQLSSQLDELLHRYVKLSKQGRVRGTSRKPSGGGRRRVTRLKP